jgi:hypothetical protein
VVIERDAQLGDALMLSSRLTVGRKLSFSFF